MKSVVLMAGLVGVMAFGLSTARAADKDIVDTAAGAGSFKTLAKALDAAGLVQTLKGPGPFTVFAPTDEAFAKLPPATLEHLLKPEKKAKLAADSDLPRRERQGDGGRRREDAIGQGRERRRHHDRRHATARSGGQGERRQDGHRREQRRDPRHRRGDSAVWQVERVVATILITGATGYIGGRLLQRLEDDGHAARCLARHPDRVRTTNARTEVVRGDCLEPASLGPALSGIEVAYYLVHSMAAGPAFAELDRRAAANFGAAAARAGVRRIVYLGGLANDDELSEHLQSRSETGDVLRSSGVPVVEFRSSVIVGAGSLSFEIIRGLVERLPVMICPRWVSTPAQPIAVDDVIAYLMAVRDLPQDGDAIFEIGGPRVVSYGDMMHEYARQRGLRRYLVPVPVLTPRLSGLWLALVTPAEAAVGRALIQGLRNSTVVQSAAARRRFAIEPDAHRRGLRAGHCLVGGPASQARCANAGRGRVPGVSPSRRSEPSADTPVGILRIPCGSCEAGSIGCLAASACRVVAARPNTVASATQSTDGVSTCMNQTGGCACRQT